MRKRITNNARFAISDFNSRDESPRPRKTRAEKKAIADEMAQKLAAMSSISKPLGLEFTFSKKG